MSFLSHRPYAPNDPSIMVPQQFVDIFRFALSRVAATPHLNVSQISFKFWEKWPSKFLHVINYEYYKVSL